MIPLNKSYKNRKVSLTIHCKYKYLDSTVQRAEDRRQKFTVRRLPFAVNVKREVKFDVYGKRQTANGKRQTANFYRLSSALCTAESKYLYLQWIVRDTFLFLYDLFKDNMKRIEQQRKYLPFAVCRKRQA